MIFLVSLIVSGGGAGWLFYMMQRRSGAGNTKEPLIGGSIAFVILFVVVFSIAKMVMQ